MRLVRYLSLMQLEYAHPDVAGYMIMQMVDEMRRHFRPVEDTVVLRVRVEGTHLKLIMELPETEL
jgi:hypothetical protein